eukprot:TRINITY_DN3809_c0_g1_i2.p1 TRINITY_DN3809_c0_g1~~TRINITY_DN3809_c0_g1_i2.p1  ORF type:complete len:312 (+),score=185.82 TRINITY_DN3809_c0_g1_i2:107-937(+)
MSYVPAEAIAKVQNNDASLTSLNLASNALFNASADENTIAIAQGLKTNTNLKELNLGGNGISVSGATALAEALKVNSTLEKLNLEKNSIDNEGLQAIAAAIKDNKGLVELNLFGQGREPGEGVLSTFIESFEYNTSLKNIIWRLTSRQSFKINACITRNNEIKRRLAAGKSVDDIDPNIRRETEARVLAERAAGLPKFEKKEEEEITSAPEATGGPYPLRVLQAKKEFLPADVDSNKREDFLSDDDFQTAFGESRESFNSSPVWKRKQKKQQLNLF